MRRQLPILLFFLLPLFFLPAGCAVIGGNTSPAPAASTPVAASPSPVDSHETPPETPPEMPPVVLDQWRLAPEQLEGRRPANIQALIGPPSLIRRDGPLYTTLYERPGCVLELVYYEAEPGAGFRLDYLTARTRAGRPAVLEMCLLMVLGGDRERVPEALRDYDAAEPAPAPVPVVPPVVPPATTEEPDDEPLF